MVSGAVFLYFHDETVGLTLHPSVSTFMAGTDPFQFFRLVEERQPSWAQQFFKLVSYWKTYRASLAQTMAILEPLRGAAFKTIWLAYNRDTYAFESATELLSSSSLAKHEIVASIDQFSASDELFAHIFFGKYLELVSPDKSNEDLFATGKALAQKSEEVFTANADWTALYQYCDQLFEVNNLENLLTTAYMFRMPALRRADAVLLSNPRLIPFLASLPIELQDDTNKGMGTDRLDAIAWEFFRQLVSPMIDPLNKTQVQKISELLKKRDKEIIRLKNRCFALAEELGDEADLELLQRNIRNHIRTSVEKEVQEVLDLDNQALNDLLDSVFADEKTWVGIAIFLYSLINGGDVLTAGSAIYALASIGSKAFKAARQ